MQKIAEEGKQLQNDSARSVSKVKDTITWDRLQNLKELYEEGFLTQTEYKTRKSQIIDDLTGTSISSSKTLRDSNVVRSEFQPPRIPDFAVVEAESAIKYIFDTKSGEWSSKSIKVKFEKQPFARGGLRRAYHLQYVNPQDALDFEEDYSGKKSPSTPPRTKEASTKKETTPADAAAQPRNSEFSFVAKMSIDPYEDRELYFSDVETQMYAKEWAKKFNSYSPPKNVDFVKVAILELTDRDGSPLCTVEKFIIGCYQKHNNNFGFISEDDRNTPQCFSHFSYEASMHTLLICDIQGVGDLYTDPQIHTIDGKGFGRGNLGDKGIDQFLVTHRCNAICKYLRLPSVNAKDQDSGTVPAATLLATYKKKAAKMTNDPSEYQFQSKRPILSAQDPLLPKRQQNSSGCCIII